MASFDFESGMRGAQAGSSTGNPYAIAAGFVIGGFFGGSKKAKAKAKAKREQKLYRQHLQTITSPEYFGKTVQKMLPSMREAVASGLGPQEQSAIATSLARGGYTGTGIGEVGRAVGVAMPQIEAFRQSLGQANTSINRELEGFYANANSKNINIGQQGFVATPESDPFGSAGSFIDRLGTMKGMNLSSLKHTNYGGGFANQFSDTYLGNYNLTGANNIQQSSQSFPYGPSDIDLTQYKPRYPNSTLYPSLGGY